MYCSNCGQPYEAGAKFCAKCGNPLAAAEGAAAPTVTLLVEPARLYAGFWKRFAAVLIDWLVLLMSYQLILTLFFGAMLPTPNGQEATRLGPSMLLGMTEVVGILLYWPYFALMECSRHQATLGKMALGIKVVDLQGRRITFARATGRFFAKYISALTMGIGFLMAAFTKKKQALHDMIAGSLVVNKAVGPEQIQEADPQSGAAL